MEEIRLGNLYGATGGNYAGWVYDKEGLVPTINTCGGGGREPIITEICAMRGRDKTNPNHRGKANENYEQVLEPNSEGICNTLTSVQKDNIVLEAFHTHTHRGGSTSNEERHDTVRCTRHCGSELSGIKDEERQSDRQWSDLPDINNGEYP